MKSTPASRAAGLAMALGGVALSLAIVAAGPSVIGGFDWPDWALFAAYYGSLVAALVLGSVSAVAVLCWFDTRKKRRAKH